MAHEFSIASMTPCRGLPPAADAAGRTAAAWIDLSLAHKVYVVFHINQGNAATVACSISRANSAAGAGAAAMTELVPIYTNLDLAAAPGPGALTRQATDAASFTTDAGLKEKLVIFEIDPAKLPMRFIAPVTGASNAANITSAQVYVVPRYAFTA